MAYITDHFLAHAFSFNRPIPKTTKNIEIAVPIGRERRQKVIYSFPSPNICADMGIEISP
jgi:hypothetical protein